MTDRDAAESYCECDEQPVESDRAAAESCCGCGERPGDIECDGCHRDYCGDCIEAYGELRVCDACALESGLDHA